MDNNTYTEMLKELLERYPSDRNDDIFTFSAGDMAFVFKSRNIDKFYDMTSHFGFDVVANDGRRNLTKDDVPVTVEEIKKLVYGA